jgi:hypothetical protein
MERVGEHPVPAGPIAARWLAYELGEARAGVPIRARLRLENAGSAPWRSRGTEGVQLSYHWLDPLGNPIEWDGVRAPLPATVEPGDEIELEATVRAPRPPGGYRLAFDLVEEHRFWFQELGSTPLELPIEVHPRIDERSLCVVVDGGRDTDTEAALAAQDEPVVAGAAVATAYLVAGAMPATDWSRLGRGDRRRFSAWASGTGRNPRFDRPLLFPSLLEGLEPETYEDLPAYAGPDALFEGRAVVRLRRRSGRPSG